MRVLFFGNSSNSVACLEALRRAHGVKLVAVVSPSPTPSTLRDQLRHRGRRLLAVMGRGGPLAQIAHVAAGVPLLVPEDVHAIAEELQALRADVVVMSGFTQILKAPLLRRLGPVLNLHPSLLPRYRGPSPCFWVLAHGERHSGVTVHRVEEGVDTGPILASAALDVPPWIDAGELRRASMRRGGALMIEALRRASESGTPQAGGTYFGQVRPCDLRLPFDGDATQAFDRARAAAPERGLTIATSAEGFKRGNGQAWREPSREQHLTLELRDAVAYPDYQAGPPGRYRRLEKGLLVACAKGCVLFRKVTSRASP